MRNAPFFVEDSSVASHINRVMSEEDEDDRAMETEMEVETDADEMSVEMSESDMRHVSPRMNERISEGEEDVEEETEDEDEDEAEGEAEGVETEKSRSIAGSATRGVSFLGTSGSFRDGMSDTRDFFQLEILIKVTC